MDLSQKLLVEFESLWELPLDVSSAFQELMKYGRHFLDVCWVGDSIPEPSDESPSATTGIVTRFTSPINTRSSSEEFL
jgi:hypothetical protein